MIDLHVHTNASDGEYSPKEVIKLAKEDGIKTIAITDHDTLSGLEEAIDAGKNLGVEVIPGIELGVAVPKGKLHILGYFVDYKDEEFKKQIELFRTYREQRNDKLLEEFQNNGIDITYSDIYKYSSNNVIGKPHMARALMEKGYVNNVEEAFTNYFKKEPYRNVVRNVMTPKEAIEILKKNNALVVIAHPVTLKLKGKELEEQIKTYKEYGVDGIECFNNIHTPEQIDELIDIAKRNDLLITAGSDYHGPKVKPGVELGKGKNNNIITDLPILENLKNYKEIKSTS